MIISDLDASVYDYLWPVFPLYLETLSCSYKHYVASAQVTFTHTDRSREVATLNILMADKSTASDMLTSCFRCSGSLANASNALDRPSFQTSLSSFTIRRGVVVSSV